MADTPLATKIKAQIRKSGPLSIADYMAICLSDPDHGYYTTRDPFGRAGDFITAPEISQMFGEILGLWAAVVWQQMGSPTKVSLVEIGPGRGTLMADALRAARQVPPFHKALSVHLVETSPILRVKQAEALIKDPPTWHESLATVPEGRAIILANELFDALPIRQLQKSQSGWRERLVTIDPETDQFAYALTPTASVAEALIYPPVRSAARIGELVEICAPGASLAQALGERAAKDGAVSLVIDYGYPVSAAGDTFQALANHKVISPLEAPGESDLTAHVDFDALARSVRAGGGLPYGPRAQGAFLKTLGIQARADILKQKATEPHRIDEDLKRLVDPDQMGRLFLAMVIGPSHGALPPGFEM